MVHVQRLMPEPILIVEDHQSVAEPLAELLADEGFPVTCVPNGAEALQYLATTQLLPGLILLDLMMPVLDGWGFRSAQLCDVRLRRIPVAVMSAGIEFMFVDQVAHMDAVAYLAKPFDPKRIVALAERFCDPWLDAPTHYD